MNLSTPALLFGTISLMLLAHTNRYALLATVIRDLHHHSRTDPSDLIRRQIPILRQRLHLTRYMQTLGVISYLLCTGSMLAIFFEKVSAAEILFGSSVVTLFLSLLLALWEVIVSAQALDMVLDDCSPDNSPRS